MLVARHGPRLIQLERIKRFDDLLRTIVQTAVADDEAESSGRKIAPMVAAEIVASLADANSAVGAIPLASSNRQASTQGAIDFGERPGFRLPIVQAIAAEYPGILRKRLLEDTAA